MTAGSVPVATRPGGSLQGRWRIAGSVPARARWLAARHVARRWASTSLQIVRSKLVDRQIVGLLVGSNIKPASRAGTEIWSRQPRSRLARKAFRGGRASWHAGVSRQARSGLAREAFRGGRASWHDGLSRQARLGLARKAVHAGRGSWHGRLSSQARTTLPRSVSTVEQFRY